jgi:LysR family transcriptional regulator, transcription activator of glutamate synthase operon
VRPTSPSSLHGQIRSDTGGTLLERQRLCLQVPPGHALASRHRVELEAAADQPFVGLQPGFGFRRVTDELCRAAGFTPRLAFEATDLATIDSLVGAGLGVAILPAGAVRGTESGAVPIPLAGVHARREIGMSWRLNTPLTLAATRFQTYVHSRPATTT